MKKYTGYLLVGLVSSMTTMGGFYLMNENGSNPFITNASNQKNGDFMDMMRQTLYRHLTKQYIRL